jgi:hypothetical protein
MTDTKNIKQKKFTREEVDALIKEAVEEAVETRISFEEAVEIIKLTDENEELKKTIAEHESTISELQKKPIKKVRQPKPLEVWEGNLSEFSDLPARSKFMLTKKEVMIWVKTPNEIKKIVAKRDDDKNKKDARACDEFDGQCWARKFNNGKGERCCVYAPNGKDYCKTHITSKLQNGDVRITGKGSIPFNKCLECDAPFNNDKDDNDVKEWYKICADRLEAFKNKTLI